MAYGVTPLQLAAETGNTAIIQLLLTAGADVESANAEGQTALMSVARTGNVAAAQLLIKRGANVNASERFGRQDGAHCGPRHAVIPRWSSCSLRKAPT